ncbi:MAG TPA: DUF5694 domain-containing protein [Saprospiraceae bacterium]|nr:DUF5694 domain-containing protein [Saprospiraceae bacterium]
MKKFYSIAIFVLFALKVFGQQSKTKVILLGVFHFNNPGLDVAKFENIDILEAKAQKEIEAITHRIAGYQPQKVFLEILPEYSTRYDSLLAQFQPDDLQKYKSESVQVGVRLMHQLGHDRGFYVDSKLNLNFESLIQTWMMNGQQSSVEQFMMKVAEVERSFNEKVSSEIGVDQILKWMNTPEKRHENLAPYTSKLVLTAGKEGDFTGADLAAEWYKRNLRIYSNILRALEGNEECIFVMFGAGHIPILELLFSLDHDSFELVDIMDLFRNLD